MNDPGDENDYREPSIDPISEVLAQDARDGHIFVCEKRELFDAMCDAEFMRDCCAACALEANGEDGS